MKLSVFDVPTVMGRVFVVKSVELGDGTRCAASAAQTLADWQWCSPMMELACSAVVAVIVGRLGRVLL